MAQTAGIKPLSAVYCHRVSLEAYSFPACNAQKAGFVPLYNTKISQASVHFDEKACGQVLLAT